ncbi:MAG TPA: hypothetical protein VGM91_13035 [Conexibacter sp.]
MRRILAVGAAVIACAAITACLVGTAQSFAKPAKHKAPVAARSHHVAPSLGRSDDLTPQILFDCSSSRSGYLTHRYSVRVLLMAQREIPYDVANYTSCPQAIRRQVIRSNARISVSIHRSRHGRAVAGRVVVRTLDGHEVDGRVVGNRQAADFAVLPGVYVVRADGQPRCSRRVSASSWRTTSVRLPCAR